MELPLVVFTVLSQMAAGLCLMLWFFKRPAYAGETMRLPDTLTMGFIIVVMASAVVASLFHLGHPMEAWKALGNAQSSWLSREVFASIMFVGLAIFTLWVWALLPLTVLAGLAVLLCSSLTYATPAYPAIYNIVPFLLFTCTTLNLGFAFGSCAASAEWRVRLRRLLVASLVFSLVLSVALPCIWSSGGTITQESALAWAYSKLYWSGLLVAFILPLLVIASTRQNPRWLPWLMLVGAFITRAQFFASTVSTITNIGGVY